MPIIYSEWQKIMTKVSDNGNERMGHWSRDFTALFLTFSKSRPSEPCQRVLTAFQLSLGVNSPIPTYSDFLRSPSNCHWGLIHIILHIPVTSGCVLRTVLDAQTTWAGRVPRQRNLKALVGRHYCVKLPQGNMARGGVGSKLGMDLW